MGTSPAATAPVKLSRPAQGLVGLAPLALLALWLAGGLTVYSHARPAPAAEAEPAPPDGPALFVQHCAYCHGERGTSQGLAGLNPRARYFGRDKYKFTTTHKGDQGGLPTDADLAYTIRTGIPGSAMPGFDQKLTDAEVRAVVGHLRTLTRAGLAERFRLEAEKNDEDPDWKEIAKKVDKLAAGDEPDALPPFRPATAESVERGRSLFLNAAKTACASCHGTDGRGGPAENDKKNDPPHQGGDGTLNRPRDLTSGVFKSGVYAPGTTDKARLYALIYYGIPGTPMPPHSKLSPQEVEDLIDYVLALKK